MSDEFTYANASRLADGLWVGGDLESTDQELATRQLDELADEGVTDIIDTRLEWNDSELVASHYPDVEYKWLGVDDLGQTMPDEWFDAGTDYARQRIADDGTVLVHCHMGINRGPSMGFAIMLTLGWDPIDALDRIWQQRPVAYVGYAEDALDWWLRKTGASRQERRRGQERIAQWRREHYPELDEVIRQTRQRDSV